MGDRVQTEITDRDLPKWVIGLGRNPQKRDFTASWPDQLWAADITYVTTDEGWLYLATVLDAWSRRVVGWAMSERLGAELVIDASNMAVGNRRSAMEVVHHSDRGAHGVLRQETRLHTPRKERP